MLRTTVKGIIYLYHSNNIYVLLILNDGELSHIFSKYIIFTTGLLANLFSGSLEFSQCCILLGRLSEDLNSCQPTKLSSQLIYLNKIGKKCANYKTSPNASIL